jgi:contractile injection system tube protein
MSEPVLVKARLIELKQDLTSELPGGKKIDVQFNPESMKVTFANQVAEPKGGDQKAGTAGRQFVGAGTTKLALTLWFDVTAMTEKPVDDVRRLTADIIHFMTPAKADSDPKKLAPPGARFSWGSFLFDGMVEGLEESLEFFSPAGKPLRASVSLTMSQQKILVSKFEGTGQVPSRPGQRPFTPAPQGSSLQQMSGAAGKDGDWQGIAAANNIEDPLRMSPGALIDLDLSVGIGGGGGAGFGVGVGFGASASIAPPSVEAGAAVSLSAGLSIN